MTDEEIAEEYARTHRYFESTKREDGTGYAKEVSSVTIKEAHLAGAKSKEKQLDKAKELIKDLLSCLYSVEYDRVSDLEEAEQFLKEE